MRSDLAPAQAKDLSLKGLSSVRGISDHKPRSMANLDDMVLMRASAMLLWQCLHVTVGCCSVQLARWANAAGMLPSAILQELASLAKQDLLRFELDPKPTLAFQV